LRRRVRVLMTVVDEVGFLLCFLCVSAMDTSDFLSRAISRLAAFYMGMRYGS
jgi:hypothetical protein